MWCRSREFVKQILKGIQSSQWWLLLLLKWSSHMLVQLNWGEGMQGGLGKKKKKTTKTFSNPPVILCVFNRVKWSYTEVWFLYVGGFSFVCFFKSLRNAGCGKFLWKQNKMSVTSVLLIILRSRMRIPQAVPIRLI